MGDIFRKIKETPDREAAELFVKKILPSYVVSFLSFCGLCPMIVAQIPARVS